MSANATRIDDLPGGLPMGNMPLASPSLPSALEPISTSVHEQAQSAPVMLPQMGEEEHPFITQMRFLLHKHHNRFQVTQLIRL